MKYFTVDDSLDELVVGKDFQFIKGDNPEAPEALIYFILFLIVQTVLILESHLSWNVTFFQKKYADAFVSSKADLYQQRSIIKKEKGISRTIWGERIVMNDHFDKELDFFSIGVIDAHTYISERLKNAVEGA